MAEELRFHLDEYVRDLVRSGIPEAEAARLAHLEFGRLENVARDCRDARGLRPFDALEQDIRYALRLMRRTPGFTLAAVATLTICLGANLAIFAVVDAVLVRPLPYPQPDRLVTVYNTYPRAGVPDDGSSVTNYYERRGRIPAFESLALYRDGAVVVGETGRTEREFITRVTPEFFGTLGLAPALGRAFTDEETRYGADHVVILGHDYWQTHFGGDPHAIGGTLRVDGLAYTVIGVLPGTFEFLRPRRLYVPLASPPDERGPDRRHSGSSSHMIARLRPGASIAEAQSQIDAHNAAMERTDPEAQLIADAGFRSLVVPFRASYVADVRPMLLVVQAGALCLLVLGAVNVASLLLVRAAGRARELALRQAIGASRRRVVGEVLVETLLITVTGGAFGIAAGAAGVGLLRVLGADRLPLGLRTELDWRSVAAALGAAIVLGVAIAVPVAWYHLRAHVAGALGAASRGSTPGPGTERLRHALLVAQIALAVTLTSGAGLLGLSLRRLADVPPGFRPEHVVSGQVSLPYQAYPSGHARVTFFDRLATGLAGGPGIAAVGIATNIPFSGNSNKSSATIEGHAPRPGEPPRGVYSYAVAGDYFPAMGLSLVSGRFLTADDVRSGAHVCVVDEDLARQVLATGRRAGARAVSRIRGGPGVRGVPHRRRRLRREAGGARRSGGARRRLLPLRLALRQRGVRRRPQHAGG